MTYTNGGFGVLISKSTLRVLVWKDSSYITIFPRTKTFKTVKDFDRNLAVQPITSSKVFEYRDPDGVTWVVSPYPFFHPGSSNNPSNTNNSLVILVFAEKSLAAKSLDSLNANIDTTTNTIIDATIITIVCTVVATIFFCFLTIEYIIARPLETMRKISEEIIRVSAEDDDQRDYRGALRLALLNLNRSDEVGVLAVEFYKIVYKLHQQSLGMRETPKYPRNPFHIGPGVNYEQLSWPQYIEAFESQNPTDLHRPADTTTTNESKAIPDLDILGSIMLRNPRDVNYSRVSPTPNADRVADDVESVAHDSNSPDTTQEVTLGCFTSLKSQLYALSGVILAGVMVAMFITVVSLSRQGETWMSKSTSEIDNTQVINMKAVTHAKSIFIQVRTVRMHQHITLVVFSHRLRLPFQSYYQQLSIDVLTAAAYTTALLNGNLTDPDWYRNGNYLKSYSYNYLDTKHRKIVETTDFSLYYATVG